MFKWLFYHWYSTTDTPSIVHKINVWSYINLKIFKIKVQNQIVYFILGLNNLYLKELKIFYKNASFELFYFKILHIFIFFFFFFIFIYSLIFSLKKKIVLHKKFYICKIFIWTKYLFFIFHFFYYFNSFLL